MMGDPIFVSPAHGLPPEFEAELDVNVLEIASEDLLASSPILLQPEKQAERVHLDRLI
jgi:hypothetical protein